MEKKGKGARAPGSSAYVANRASVGQGVESHEGLVAVYSATCAAFGKLTDTRFKLLTLLPVATALGTYASGGGVAPGSTVIALFGIVTTLALATYNLRNDQLYDELVAQAGDLERRMGILQGAFTHRPRTWKRLPRFKIEHGWPIAVIYVATTIVWCFLLLRANRELLIEQWVARVHEGALEWLRKEPYRLQSVILLLSATPVVIAWRMIRRRLERQGDTLRKAVHVAMRCAVKAKRLRTWKPCPAASGALKALLGGDAVDSIRRVYVGRHYGFYSLDVYTKRGSAGRARAAALLIGNVTDLSPRWLLDVFIQRRPVEEKSQDESGTPCSCPGP